jgi:hypothetical protein
VADSVEQLNSAFRRFQDGRVTLLDERARKLLYCMYNRKALIAHGNRLAAKYPDLYLQHGYGWLPAADRQHLDSGTGGYHRGHRRHRRPHGHSAHGLPAGA